MNNSSLEKIQEETKLSVEKGKKLVWTFSILNLVITLISWLFNVYSFPFALISILFSISIFLLTFVKYLWFINSMYRAYWYLAILFAMIDDGLNALLGILSVFILAFDIYSSISMLFSKNIEDYLYERKSKRG